MTLNLGKEYRNQEEENIHLPTYNRISLQDHDKNISVLDNATQLAIVGCIIQMRIYIMRLYLLVNKIQPIGRITEQDQSVPFCCFFDNSNTNKKIIFLPLLLDILTCHTIQFENQKNCVLYYKN